MKPRRKPPPPPFGQMTTAINRSPKLIKKPLLFCESCVGFIIDWFQLPPHKTEYWASKVKYSVLKRNAPILARAFYRILLSMTPIDEYVITNTLALRLKMEEKKVAKLPKNPGILQFLEELAWLTMLEAVITQKGASDINHIKALLQDSVMIKLDFDCDMWIGYILCMLWSEVPKIHMEHRKLTDATGGGPAFGMKSYTPAPRVSSHVSVECPRKILASASSPPPLLGALDIEEDDLYR